MAILIDTSALLAYVSSRDSNHAIASRTMKALSKETGIVPTPVLSELFYMTAVRLNYKRAVQVFSSIRLVFQIQPLIDADMARMEAVMNQYHDIEFDYADVSLMALAERLNITQVFTFDRRDFAIYRPAHCPYLELIPESY